MQRLAGELADAAGGLEAGSDEWFEAKYFQILCLRETDPEAARKTLKQFQLLYPEVRSAAWQSKFRTLGETGG